MHNTRENALNSVEIFILFCFSVWNSKKIEPPYFFLFFFKKPPANVWGSHMFPGASYVSP